MNLNNKKEIIDNDEDDYIINNDQEIVDFENNEQNYNSNYNQSNIIKAKSNNEQNKLKNNKSPKGSHREGAEWIKEAKAKFKKDQNNNKNNININKTDSKKSNNKKTNKKIINYDDIPVGGGMGGGTNFNIEIKVPNKANPYIENKLKNNFDDNYGDNSGNEKEVYLKKKLDDKINKKKQNLKNMNNKNNNYYDDNNISNNEQLEMERKNSLVSMITQTCDREMVGRSEFIGIGVNQNNLNPNISREINLEPNIFGLSEGKQTYSLYDKNDNLISTKNNNFKDNIDISNFSSINKLTEFNVTQNLREKTENAIQLQNVQRELDNEIEMNKRLQRQIENDKSEFNNLREELVKKSDTINELQQKISKLEKDLFLQGKQLIEAEAKPSQENYEEIVNNYDELKRNFDKAIERIKNLSDENAELMAKNIRLEENNKKLKRELKLNKDKILQTGDNKNKKRNSKNFVNNKIENDFENEDENEIEDNDYNENNEDINDDDVDFNTKINKKTNKNLDINVNEKLNKEQNNNRNSNINEDKKEIVEKRSIIPEDNDIFGTRNYSSNTKNIQKPRKIQEDGIPLIKRMEEKDNVKDILVNNYATNDDDYYNRPPVGKPKARRIKRSTNTASNNFKNNSNVENISNNNYIEQKTKNLTEIEKNNYNYNENDFNNNLNEEEEIKYNKYNNKNNFRKFSTKEAKNKKIGSGLTTSVGIFPSQLKALENEREILNLESKLFNLQKERDLINDEYLKFPEYPKKRKEINAKRKIEIQLEEMNKEISSQKLKIRELKEKK